jgi:phosphoribosylamine--glycine ligase
MKILVVGSGGREHALVWKIAQSPLVEKIYAAPGNAGIAEQAEILNISSEDVDGLVEAARAKQIDLVVVGPEAPLTMGLVDRLEEAGIKAFGPSAAAAQMEGSKAYSKEIMVKYGVPTAQARIFSDAGQARDYIAGHGGPLVVKADGLAAGKGVILCQTTGEALDAVEQIMVHRLFGSAGDRVVIEDYLIGEEASYLVFTDGETILPLPSSQDHKSAHDGDTGPNTGGMGAYSPAPVITPELERQILDTVMRPVIDGLAQEGRPYKGVLYAGLMITPQGIKTLEFNVRFGDPECQPLVMRLESDLVEIMVAAADGRLNEVNPRWDERAALCLVLASGGYPGSYEKGKVISGLKETAALENVVVFHAGTAYEGDRVVTAGGRVLGVTALGKDVREAIDRAYGAAAGITFEGVHYRKDIGHKALDREKGFIMTEKGFVLYDPARVPTLVGQTDLEKRSAPRVGIVMGSDSDLEAMSAAAEALKEFGVSYEMTVCSAHRTPERAARYARTARERGLGVIIAGAGWAAHLAGALAAGTTLPVIGVPLESSPLSGMDALLSTVQMPPGVPVATVALGKGGARNAAVLAVQILALADPGLADKLDDFKKRMAEGVDRKAQKVAETYKP